MIYLLFVFAQLSFEDVTEAAGLLPHVTGLRGHAAAWGDVEGSGYPSLYVGTFHNAGSKPGLLLRNARGRFTVEKRLSTSGIGSGALFADLTNAGRLDLFAANCAHGKDGVARLPSVLFRNDGRGAFTAAGAGVPDGYAARGLAALDADGDGRLDLLLAEQYYSPKVKNGPLLLLNRGKHRFDARPLLPGHGCLAVAAGDVNGDTWPDVFVCGGNGDHRLLLNDGRGGFTEAAGTRDVFRWKLTSPEDLPAGVCLADVTGDGRPDVVIGHHFKTPWVKPVSIRLYVNRGVKGGTVVFEDVTEKAGLTALPMKAPHVEVQDLDNDGFPDLVTSIVKFKDGKPHPVVYRGLGAEERVPKFQLIGWDANGWPTAADLALKRAGPLFAKALKERTIEYMAAGPTADYDRDGRRDIFLCSWWPESRSLLLRNTTKGNHWLTVRVEGPPGVNRAGIGARVNLYTPVGHDLVGSREIAAGYGYCSGQEAEAHFGLGSSLDTVDVEVILPHGKGTLTRKAVKADQRVVIGR